MTRALVLRPEPGNAATVARLGALGIPARAIPLFHVVPIAWKPLADRFDALLLTSANAVRHAGPDLSHYAMLPVFAVGAATAAAARSAGLTVVHTGDRDVAAIVAAAGARRLLHLAGRHRQAVPGVTAIPVYASEPLSMARDDLQLRSGDIVLLHSARAARRLAKLVAPDARHGIAIATLSPTIAADVGEGWARIAVAPVPSDSALVALVATMIDRAGGRADNAAP